MTTLASAGLLLYNKIVSSVRLFYIILGLILSLEGLGVPFGHEAAYYLILAAPLFLFSLDKTSLKAPRNWAILTVILVLLLVISGLLGTNIPSSLERILFYLATFLIFIFVVNHQEEIEKNLLSLIVKFGFIFSIFAIGLEFFGKKIPHGLLPAGYQLVYPSFSPHNHLGDYLVLPTIISFYFLFTKGFKKEYFWPLVLFIPLILLSFSRSAYVALLTTTVFLVCYLIKKQKLILGGISAVKLGVFLGLATLFLYASLVLSLSTTWQSQEVPIFSTLNNFLRSNGISYKGFSGDREVYAGQVLSSFLEKPLFGVGPGNFLDVSYKYTQTPNLISSTSHNIFLDFLSEGGILAALAFLALIFLTLVKSKKELPFFLGLALLINFQTDYTYMLYSLFLLFFILLGVGYKEEQKLKLFGVSIIFWGLFTLASAMLLGNFLISSRAYQLSFYVYPLNNSVYPPIIDSYLAKKDDRAAYFYMNIYQKLFPGSFGVEEYLAQKYDQLGQKDMAYEYLKMAFNKNRFMNLDDLVKLYNFKKEYEGAVSAEKFAKEVVSSYKSAKYTGFVTQEYKDQVIKDFCARLKDFTCSQLVF